MKRKAAEIGSKAHQKLETVCELNRAMLECKTR